MSHEVLAQLGIIETASAEIRRLIGATVPGPPPPPGGLFEPTPGMSWRQRFTSVDAPSRVPLADDVPDEWPIWRFRARISCGDLADGRHVLALLLPGSNYPWPLTWEYNKETTTNAVIGSHPTPMQAFSARQAIGGRVSEVDVGFNLTDGLTFLLEPDTLILDPTAAVAERMRGGALRWGATAKEQDPPRGRRPYAHTNGVIVEALLEVGSP